jgi:hypothetical protein
MGLRMRAKLEALNDWVPVTAPSLRVHL